MRSRDVRPFTVELKNKRRPAATLPPSLWGDAAKLFKEPPPRGAEQRLGRRTLDLTAPTPEAKSAQEARPTRILPDLRVTEVQVKAEIVAVRVRRTRRKKGGNIALRESEKQTVHQMKPASMALNLNADSAPLIQIEPSAPPSSVAIGENTVLLSHQVNIEVSRALLTASTVSPIAVTQEAIRRGRKWARGVHELPRGERWKRRLPEVCR